MEMLGSYNPWLVALSYVIASNASFLSLRLAPDVPECDLRTAVPVRGVLPAAATLGFGIWAMHFTGMAAFHLHGADIGYRSDLTILSLIVAIAFTAIGFATLTLLPDPREALLIAGIPMATGILTMHFMGMAAMTGVTLVSYRTDLLLTSAVIALAGSIAALFLSTLRHRLLSSVAGALVMGLAICGMHYTGMEAGVFSRDCVPSCNPPT